MALFENRKKELVTKDQFDALVLKFEELIMQLHSRSQPEIDVDIIANRVVELLLPNLSSLNQSESVQNNYISDNIDGLEKEKKASEIVSLLFSKMHNPHGTKLRSFYTDLEKHVKVALSKIYKQYKEANKGVDFSKFPHRKIDIILDNIDYKTVYEFAKEYKYKTIA